MFELITEGVKTVRELLSKTPKNQKKLRNAGALVAGAGAASFMIPDEFVDVVPEPWVSIVRGALMVVGGVFALIAQSKTEKKQEDGNKLR